MTGATTCAASGCDNAVPDRNGTPGRPFKYRSPRCRPSRTRRRGSRPPLLVEVDHPDTDPGGDTLRHARSWTVSLRRGSNTVIVGQHLGRFSATALARDLQQLLDPQPDGGTIE